MSRFKPWKIVHFNLAQPLTALTAEPDSQGLYVVFWWQQIPLGHQMLPDPQLPMTREQVLTLAAQTIAPTVAAYEKDRVQKSALAVEPSSELGAESLEAQLQDLLQRLTSSVSIEPSSSSQTVSLVICTRDRPEQLAQCLRSLQALSQQPDEIVVVDNAPSSDATRQVVAQMPGVRYVLEPRPGLDIARNTGVRHSSSDLIAFTDDDVVIHPDWIAQVRQSFEDPQVMAVTGLVLAAEIATEAQWIFECYWSFNQGYRPITFDSQFFQQWQGRGVPVWKMGAGANMAFRRKIFDLIGDFDERLDVGAAGCSGDSEFWYRVLAEGWTCRYEPRAVIYHYHRQELSGLKRQMFYYMRGHVAALLVQFEKYQHSGNLYHLLWTLPRHYLNLLMRSPFKRFQQRYSTLLVEIGGCFSGLKFYWQNRKPKESLPQPASAPQP
jgi:glycosyltransferase involved in cell wall biosynthesis